MLQMKLLLNCPKNCPTLVYCGVLCDCFQLGPWLAVEIPDLIEKGLISHKDKTDGEN